VERATIDRIQRMIDDETTERFSADLAPRLTLLHYGDHPEIEPGELYLQVILDQDGPEWNAWTEEQRDRIWDFRDQRLPEAKGVMITAGTPDTAGRRPTSIMKVAVSLLDPQEDELARGLTPVMARLGPVDLATLDALITAGIAASRSEGARWALARVREQPAYAKLSERAREPAEPEARAGLDRAVRDQLQSRLDEQVKEHFPTTGCSGSRCCSTATTRGSSRETCWSGYLRKSTRKSRTFLPGCKTMRRCSANSTASSRRSFPGSGTWSSGSARTAATAISDSGSAARRKIQPGASTI